MVSLVILYLIIFIKEICLSVSFLFLQFVILFIFVLQIHCVYIMASSFVCLWDSCVCECLCLFSRPCFLCFFFFYLFCPVMICFLILFYFYSLEAHSFPNQRQKGGRFELGSGEKSEELGKRKPLSEYTTQKKISKRKIGKYLKLAINIYYLF